MLLLQCDAAAVLLKLPDLTRKYKRRKEKELMTHHLTTQSAIVF
jgi:hypothetical protein